MPLTLTVTRPCETETGKTVPVGTVVNYLGHVPGGMVRILFDGEKHVIHPGATKELGRQDGR